SGVVAKLAFEAAGDPSKFPELKTEEGLDPWTPLKFYRSVFLANNGLVLETGALDERTGRSFAQISALSRSQHRSQDFGSLQFSGPARTAVRLEAEHGPATSGATAAGEGVAAFFAGVPRDTSWVARFADSLRATISAPRIEAVAPAIAAALPKARTARQRENLEGALATASGLVMDAVSNDGDVIPGQTFQGVVTLFNAGSQAVTLDSVDLELPAGWRATIDSTTGSTVRSNTVGSRRFTIVVPPDAKPTQPYFLDHPLKGAMYDWTGVAPALRGLPLAPPLVRATVVTTVRGVPVHLTRELSHRYVDQGSGEIRRPITVVPALDVTLSPSSVLWPSTGAPTRTFDVTLKYNGTGKVSGRVRLESGAWPAPPPQTFLFERTGESRMYRFTLHRPAGVTAADITVRAVGETDDGAKFSQGVTLIDYPHVRATPWVMSAESNVRVAPITLPSLAKVGYIRGAADHVPEALTQVGLNVVLLSKDTIERGDLSSYGAIVIGTRAYEADSSLMRHNDRLLEYAKNGGLIIVQYQQYDFINGNYAPYRLSIARPHDRVTDETVPVRVLNPNDAALSRPNRIGTDDWDGWPQERGLYFAHDWDPAYHPVVEMGDPGMPPLQGGLLVAKYGTGTYVYTGLSFNRALPAAVPGAFRLFLNLLNLKARDVP
ncbi:MAG TPA: NEW3 domain-containing protein, partial [Gemmatimonadales bacterium]